MLICWSVVNVLYRIGVLAYWYTVEVRICVDNEFVGMMLFVRSFNSMEIMMMIKILESTVPEES